jgi:hypothetical protein
VIVMIAVVTTALVTTVHATTVVLVRIADLAKIAVATARSVASVRMGTVSQSRTSKFKEKRPVVMTGLFHLTPNSVCYLGSRRIFVQPPSAFD